MCLADEAIEACGGLNQWRRLQKFTAHLSISGDLCRRKGHEGVLNEIVAEGTCDVQRLQISGLSLPSRQGLFQPDRVSIESPTGEELRSRDRPHLAFAGHRSETMWDDLHLIYYAGAAIWCYLTAPFHFAMPGVRTEELAPLEEKGKIRRRLRVIYPDNFATLSLVQVFHFDEAALQCRVEYESPASVEGPITQHITAYESFSGISIPTLRREYRLTNSLRPLRPTTTTKIEVFDAKFE
jgi:hypothetical protein